MKTELSIGKTMRLALNFLLALGICGLNGVALGETEIENEYFAEFGLARILEGKARELVIVGSHEEEVSTADGIRQEFDAFGFELREIDLSTGLETVFSLDEYEQETTRIKEGNGKPLIIVTCESEEAGEVDCLNDGWFTTGERSISVKGSFTVEKSLGGLPLGLATADVDLRMAASNQPLDAQMEREIGNRAISLDWEILRTEDGILIDNERELTGTIPGRVNQISLEDESFSLATVTGSIVIEGVDWMQGMELQFGVIGSERNFELVTGVACGDGVCTEGAEDCFSCLEDCGACILCGDGICSFPEETVQSCFTDCNFCGDGICYTPSGEDCQTCVSDCGAANGTCEPDFGDCFNCLVDCAPEECSF